MIFLQTIITFLKDKEYRSLLFTSVLILAIGSITYHWIEGWSWIDSLYFSVITLTTIGYGDFSPQTSVGKLFTIFYILMGLGMILSFIHTVYNHYNEIKRKAKSKGE
ncbi:potassium channel family protein [Membranihabitans maritimus]|uniref:potassium channel family protein n=1 Tax=Membranihabitans maritimus TaxID=2904244 RepID=UPI001F3CA23A|nr:potassium channel family protein [Membranihabitans maritimus]